MQRWHCATYDLVAFNTFSFQSFCFFKLFIFKYGFTAKVTCEFLVIRSNGKTHRNKHFSSQKNDGFFQIKDQIKVGTAVNRALPFLHGVKLKSTPLNKIWVKTWKCWFTLISTEVVAAPVLSVSVRNSFIRSDSPLQKIFKKFI